MVTEQYVSFEMARLLKENGFDVCTKSFYKKTDQLLHHNTCALAYWGNSTTLPAPTQQMALRWLRETHKLHIEVEVYYCEDGQMWLAKIQRIGDGNTTLIKTCMCNDTYETAVENALDYCLKNL